MIFSSFKVYLISVGSYPTKILIDDKGVIIGGYSGEDSAMDAKLAEVFKQI